MDDADRAQMEIEREIERLIVASRSEKSPSATGYCLWCGEPLPSVGHGPSAAMPAPRWCDAHCRDAWEASQR